ncbi:Prohormone-1 [Armadillidium nasatum]|uniref:Prohormone-1 n=1 Tax=Armadillidium nasatum TaxID=96803 RepID=A0A5N5TD87_9CRUS|nr:Prohormone-1 [Armadillidium nasatum]
MDECNGNIVCCDEAILFIVEDDGSMDAALLNYLFAKQMIERLSNGRDISELQQKRSYWKQCAFNAVSCFGRRNGDITMEKANF